MAASSLTALPSDLLHSRILTRLHGPSLVSTSSASSQLRLLCSDQILWRLICTGAWPSTNDPQLRHVISSHRSFFSDVFPLLDCRSLPYNPHRPLPPQLISAVDIHYQGTLLFSTVHSMETETSWFLNSPFRVDLLDPKDQIPTPLTNEGDDWVRHLEENLTVSWIVIDPVKNRAANISSRSAVKVQRHWLSGDIQIQYATIMAGDYTTSSELVECGVVVNCGKLEEDEEEEEGVGKEMNVTEVSLRMLDMEGKHLNGKKSLQILMEAVEKGKRIKGKRDEGKERYEEYTEIKKKRNARKERIENTLDMVCIATGITIFLGFWCFILFR